MALNLFSKDEISFRYYSCNSSFCEKRGVPVKKISKNPEIINFLTIGKLLIKISNSSIIRNTEITGSAMISELRQNYIIMIKKINRCMHNMPEYKDLQ